jgi:hypothetical protein
MGESWLLQQSGDYSGKAGGTTNAAYNPPAFCSHQPAQTPAQLVQLRRKSRSSMPDLR